MTIRLSNLQELRHYRRNHLQYDLIAGMVVFLVAIPLCLGVALASGAPLFAGILSGIIGGVIVGLLSGSQFSVSGPAAGMAAVVLATIVQLGDFNSFLLALFLAGLLQMLIGFFKAGFIADYVPSNVVQGLLCAIGILLIAKQLPFAFSLSTDLTELKTHLLDTTEGFTLAPLFELHNHLNTGAMLIAFLSLVILIVFQQTDKSWLKATPAPIVVVVFSACLNELLIVLKSPLAQTLPHMVNLPNHESFSDILGQLQFPNWAALYNPKIYMYACLLAIIASLESLLNIKAGEKLDKQHRHASKDRELFAQGAGNLLAGLLGGIPITSVIVRTSVNIQAGSKTKCSTIYHGLFLITAVVFVPHWLNRIPLASIASILLFTGYQLTRPALYKTMYNQGMDRFIPFIATTVSIVFLNLLTGILIGLGISFFYILKNNSSARLDIIKEIYPNGITSRLLLPQYITFLNKASLTAELDSIPVDSQLIIDARYSHYIDKEIIELIQEFKENIAPLKNIALNLTGFQNHYAIHNYIDFINVTTYDVQTKLEPYAALAILREGNQRFLKDTRIHRNPKIDIQYSAQTQHPIAVVLGCIDSRVPVETIFDMGFGDLFCVRIGGNIINSDILASIEYACYVVGAKLIVVLGHTRCGAISAACDGVEEGHITELLAKIKPSVEAEKKTVHNRNGKNEDFVSEVTSLNITHTLLQIYKDSPILKSMIEENQIGLAGALYNVESGQVVFKDFSRNFPALDPHASPILTEKIQRILQDAGI